MNETSPLMPGEPPRITLGQWPTPLIRVERFAREAGLPPFWIKRDDLSGLEVSGNKIRKLEYILAAMQRNDQDTLITEGTCQSNHCRASAAACAKLGMHARLLFRPLPPPGDPQGNHLLDVLFGAEIRTISREQLSARRSEIIDEQLCELRAAGRTPRYTPAGASEPLGCSGYIPAMHELAAQLAETGISAADVVLGVSSGGTMAGAVLGAKIAKNAALHVRGVPVSDDVRYHTSEISRLCAATISEFRLPVRFAETDLSFIDGFVGAGYAIPDPRAVKLLARLARSDAIVLDPVYTAKAFAGFVDRLAAGAIGAGQPAVFVHTGGIFSNFAWPHLHSRG